MPLHLVRLRNILQKFVENKGLLVYYLLWKGENLLLVHCFEAQEQVFKYYK